MQKCRRKDQSGSSKPASLDRHRCASDPAVVDSQPLEAADTDTPRCTCGSNVRVYLDTRTTGLRSRPTGEPTWCAKEGRDVLSAAYSETPKVPTGFLPDAETDFEQIPLRYPPDTADSVGHQWTVTTEALPLEASSRQEDLPLASEIARRPWPIEPSPANSTSARRSNMPTVPPPPPAGAVGALALTVIVTELLELLPAPVQTSWYV